MYFNIFVGGKTRTATCDKVAFNKKKEQFNRLHLSTEQVVELEFELQQKRAIILLGVLFELL